MRPSLSRAHPQRPEPVRGGPRRGGRARAGADRWHARRARRVLAWVRVAAFAGLGRWSDVERLLPFARATVEGIGRSTYRYRYESVAARLAASRGEVEEARRLIAKTREQLATMGYAFQRSLILADLALTSWTIGRADEALAMAREAAAAADAAGSPLGRLRAGAALGLALPDGRERDRLIASTLELSQDEGLAALWAGGRPGGAGRGPRACASRRPWPARGRARGDHGARRPAAAGLRVAADRCDRRRRGPSWPRRRARRPAATQPSSRASCATPTSPFAAQPGPAGGACEPRGRRCGWEASAASASFAATCRSRRAPSGPTGRDELLAALLCAGGPVPRARMAEWLWPDVQPGRARRRLSDAVRRLRRRARAGARGGARGIGGGGDRRRPLPEAPSGRRVGRGPLPRTGGRGARGRARARLGPPSWRRPRRPTAGRSIPSGPTPSGPRTADVIWCGCSGASWRRSRTSLPGTGRPGRRWPHASASWRSNRTVRGITAD